jgi:hypothetical protein
VSNFSITHAQFTDYVGSKGYVSPLNVKLVDGRWLFDLSASGLSMDHDNLKSQLTTPATAKGLPASIQFQSEGLLELSGSSYELVLVLLSGGDRFKTAGELEISVALSATVSSNSTRLTIATNQQEKDIAISPPIDFVGGKFGVKFPLTVEPLVKIETGSAGFNGTFELASLFAFVSGNSLLKWALNNDLFSLAGQRFMSIELRPFGSSQSLFSIDVRLPISTQSNQAPQIVKTPAPILLTDVESSLSLASLFSDASADTVTYSIKSESESDYEPIAADLNESFWFERVEPDTQATFTLRASDQRNAAAEIDLQVTRAIQNESPVAYAFDSNLQIANTWRYGAKYHRNATTEDSDALQLGDVISTLKFFLRLQTPDDVQQRAADYDDDGDIDLSDVIGALKGFLHLPGSTPTWEIFDADASDGVALVGLLNGDIDGSWGISS